MAALFMPPSPPLFTPRALIRRYHYQPDPPFIHHPFFFQQQERRLQNDFLQQQAEIYNQCKRLSNLTKSRWMSSGNNKMLKLNTDGSSKGNPGPSSFGGLIRDSKGRWLWGYMGKMEGKSHTSLDAEVWSIYKGLCLIKEKNLSNIMIETDCETILRLRPESLDKNHPLKKILEDIDTIKVDHKCVIVHTRRDGNQCADVLANLGGRQTDECVFLKEPPAMLLPYLLRDTESAIEFERNRQ